MAFDRMLSRLEGLLDLLVVTLISLAAAAMIVLPSGEAAAGPALAPIGGAGSKITGLDIPSLKVAAPVVPIEVTPAGVLDPPKDIEEVGWWKRSARAGAGQGQMVVTGHNASRDDGVFDNLHKARKGALVVAHTPRGDVRYRVTSKVELTHKQLADRAVKLFGQDRKQHRLVMITCSDYRNGVWNKNFIVFASPA